MALPFSFCSGYLFSTSCIITYILALFYMFLTLPVYSTAKATYMLGLTPCFAVLCAGGLDVLTRKPFMKATIYGIIACWAVGAFGSYFVFNCSPEEVYVKDKNYLGTILLERGELEEAIEHYLQVLRIKPDYVDAHNNLGNALEKQGRTAEAIEHYLQALRIKPDLEEAHYNLGNALDEQGRTAEAIEHYLQALRIKPDFEGAHNNLGIALARKGNIEGAIAHFRKALRINPNNIPAKNNLKKALMMQQQKQ
jgi:tetratricopeptide (TPR) repeat protein